MQIHNPTYCCVHYGTQNAHVTVQYTNFGNRCTLIVDFYVILWALVDSS